MNCVDIFLSTCLEITHLFVENSGRENILKKSVLDMINSPRDKKSDKQAFTDIYFRCKVGNGMDDEWLKKELVTIKFQNVIVKLSLIYYKLGKNYKIPILGAKMYYNLLSVMNECGCRISQDALDHWKILAGEDGEEDSFDCAEDFLSIPDYTKPKTETHLEPEVQILKERVKKAMGKEASIENLVEYIKGTLLEEQIKEMHDENLPMGVSIRTGTVNIDKKTTQAREMITSTADKIFAAKEVMQIVQDLI